MNTKRFLLLILTFVGCLLWGGQANSSAQSSRAPVVFDVSAYGAKADCTKTGSTASCTNNVAAIRKAISAVNANGGGIVYFPAPQSTSNDIAYWQQTGDPSTDPNITTITVPIYALYNITANNVTVVFHPKANLRTTSTYLCQTNTGGGTLPCKESLFYFGNGVTVIENFQLLGNFANMSFAPASPASYFTGDNSANGFDFWNGKTKRAYAGQIYVDGFPNVGTIDGYTSVDSDVLADAVMEDVRVLEYGSGADDLGWYVQGNVTFERCWFITSRKSSHGVYTGSLKPWLRVNNCYFSGQDESAGLNNKYGIQIYQTSGTSAIREIWITNNTFWKVRNGIWGEHVNGASGGILEGVHITGNSFSRSSSTVVGTAIQLQYANNCFVQDNFAKYQTSVLSAFTQNKNLTVTNNQCMDCTGLLAATGTNNSYIAGNQYRRSSVASTGATRFNVAGTQNTIEGNIIVDGGSSSGSPVGMIVNGTGNIANANQIYATASQTYSIMFQAANCHQCILSNNHWNNNGSAYNDIAGDGMTIVGNQSNKLSVINGSGSVYTRVIGNKQYSSSQMRLTGLCIPQNNDITGGWETITGAYGGSGNLTSSADLDFDSAAFAASYTPHAGVYKSASKTLTGNITINAATNPIKGQTFTFDLIQDGTGGRTLTWNAVYKVEAVCAASATTTASTRTVVSYIYNGTNWVQTSCKSGL